MKLNWGTNMARLIGRAIFKICRLLISSCKLLFGTVVAIKVGKPTIFKFLSIIARLQNSELKQLFHIENGNSDTGQEILSLRLGEKHSSFAISNKSGSELYELAYCSVDSWNENEVTAFFSAFSCLQNSFYKVQVVYDFRESLLISTSNYSPDIAGLVLNMVSGGNSSNTNIVSEQIPERQLYNIYAVPKEIHEWINKKFSSARFWHQNTIGIKNITATGSDGSLLVDIRKDDFSVLAAKDSKILLAQTYTYATPEDILFYLLKICQQFSLSQREVELQLSGLIDKQSALYKELFQYFITITFREASWNVRNDYPAHFFTALNDLAKCGL